MEYTSRSELARILAPLTILPGADRMTEGLWSSYHAVLKGYYPFELTEVVLDIFKTAQWWPKPVDFLSRLGRKRQLLGPNWDDRLKVIAAGGQDPGSMDLLTEAEREAIVLAIPGAARIGSANSGQNRQQSERNR